MLKIRKPGLFTNPDFQADARFNANPQQHCKYSNNN